jgi:hypothetical protein
VQNRGLGVRGEERSRPLVEVLGPHRQRDLASFWELERPEVVVDARNGIRRKSVAEDRILDRGVHRLAV